MGRMKNITITIATISTTTTTTTIATLMTIHYYDYCYDNFSY